MKNVFLLIALLFIGIASCKKDTECVGIVTVQDTLGKALPGATVRLFAGDINRTETTDAAGQARFEFISPAILDIEASHPGYSYTIAGMITLEEGKEIKQTVRF